MAFPQHNPLKKKKKKTSSSSQCDTPSVLEALFKAGTKCLNAFPTAFDVKTVHFIFEHGLLMLQKGLLGIHSVRRTGEFGETNNFICSSNDYT